jgi:hypothetical protein
MAQGFLFAPALKTTAFKELARALNGGPKALPIAAPVAEPTAALTAEAAA